MLPIELSNLPLLKSITFECCDRDLFENIPEGLLLSGLQQVKILGGITGSFPSLSTFWKFLPDALKELLFNHATIEESDECLSALQNHDFGFRDSLTIIDVSYCKLKEGDLEWLLFEILPWFANLHTLNVGSNSIERFQGI